MDKTKILNEIIRELKREFMTLATSAMQAREAATSEEAKPENKYDTRGLEASYLAGAQAARAQEVRKTLEQIQRLELKNFNDQTPIGATALVEAQVDEEDPRLFFLLAILGGISVKVSGRDIMTLSLDSPLGRELNSRLVGESFSLNIKGVCKDYEIISVQ